MILVFDLTNPATFKSCSKWLQEVERYAEEDVVVILAGNKSDLATTQRLVSQQEINELTFKYSMKYMETSAKTGEGVQQVFQKLTELVVEKMDQDMN